MGEERFSTGWNVFNRVVFNMEGFQQGRFSTWKVFNMAGFQHGTFSTWKVFNMVDGGGGKPVFQGVGADARVGGDLDSRNLSS